MGNSEQQFSQQIVLMSHSLKPRTWNVCDELNYRMLFCFLSFVEINYPDPTNLRKKRCILVYNSMGQNL